ncbi:MAG: hypothetical protein OXT64_05615 [Gammaproteobacteria bacterium]|nr:hypothetical protein [Gammaproteobacteria bacterium]
MTWLIVGGLLVLAFAPILWLMPTKRDRQLVRLRERARREGLVVEVASVPKRGARAEELVGSDGVARDVTQPCCAYRLPASGSWRVAPRWFLLRDAHGSVPIPGWTVHPEVPLPCVDAAYWRAVIGAATGLEDQCLGMEASEGMASWYWSENSRGREAAELVAEIAQRLRAIAVLQAGFEVSRSPDE